MDTKFQTDHFPLNMKIPSDELLLKNELVYKNVRELYNMDLAEFRKSLLNSDITKSAVFTKLSLEDSISLYNSTLINLMDTHCPKVLKRYRPSRLKSKWFNSDLQNYKQRKRQAERKLRKHQNIETKKQLRKLRNQYNYQLKITRSKYYERKISETLRDSGKLYKVVNKLAGTTKERKIPTRENKEIVAEKMAGYYVEKVSTIRRQIVEDNSSLELEQTAVNEKSPIFNQGLQQFCQIGIDELKNNISKIKNKTCSLDPVPTSILKQCIDLLGPILLHIINSSIRRAVFPTALKHAIVTPIIKDECKSSEDFKNYRPVSNLPFLAKLLEMTYYVQINNYIEAYKLHSTYQSSYRKNHSCETGLLRVVGDIQKMVKDKNVVSLILLDSSAAFDTVNHRTLLSRLKYQFSITGSALETIQSYLENRTFSVVINDCMSRPKQLEHGVPQGSILGPLFYNLYTVPIEKIAEKHGLHCHVYADDVQLYFSFKQADMNIAKQKLEGCMNEIKSWMKENFLKLNADKTVIKMFMPSNTTNKPENLFTYKDSTTEIKPSSSAKVLGVTLTTKMDFNEFVTKKIQVCNMHLRNLRNVKEAIPHKVKLQLVTQFIFSTLDYCNILLINAPKFVTKRLQVTMNNAVRFVFGLKRREHISEFLFKLHILPINFRIRFKASLMAYKIENSSTGGVLLNPSGSKDSGRRRWYPVLHQ